MRWGIAGTGAIARLVAPAFAEVKGARLAAVGSRTAEAAASFADTFAVARRHASYEALAADPEVDLVYVATPNALHAPLAKLFLAAGKGVLVEKPFAVNAREAREIAAAASAAERFAMEAMWTRFTPAVRKALSWIAGGAIGEVRAVEASFGFRAEPHELPPLLSRELAVGSLLDVGVYPISLAHAAFGRAPSSVSCAAELEGGVDRQAAFALRWDGGGLAAGMSSVVSETSHDAWIGGSAGSVRLEAPFWNPPAAVLLRADGTQERFAAGGGYAHEIAAVTEAALAGAREHPWMALSESVAVMETLDRLRAAAGVSFPQDR